MKEELSKQKESKESEIIVLQENFIAIVTLFMAMKAIVCHPTCHQGSRNILTDPNLNRTMLPHRMIL